MQIIRKPLTEEEMKIRMDEFFYIEGIVPVDLRNFLSNDDNTILDVLSEKMIGKTILEEVNYSVVGHEGDILLIQVTGSIPEYLVVEYDN